MHFFYSFLNKSVDEYNQNNTDDNKRCLMLNAIALGASYREMNNIPFKKDFFPVCNALWQKSFSERLFGRPSVKIDMALSVIINAAQDTIFMTLSELSKFQRITIDSEIQDRKASWDTYAVEVD